MKVGEYVRTKDGHIEKIIDKYKATYGYKIVVNEDFKFKHYEHNYIKHIIKSSPNIIDLIEVGDYVNGKKVVNKQYHYTDEDNYDMGEWCIFYENVALGDYQYDIKSIVTKEVYASVEYRVETD